MKRPSARREGGQPSQRQLRVGEVVRHALAELVQRGEIADPALDGAFVSISEVVMTPDLKFATAYVTTIGPGEPEALVEALQRHRKFLRGVIAKRINLRFAPELRFAVDHASETGARIDALLASPEVRRDLDKDGKGD